MCERGKHRYEMNTDTDELVYDEKVAKDTEKVEDEIRKLFEQCEDMIDCVQLRDWLTTEVGTLGSRRMLDIRCGRE